MTLRFLNNNAIQSSVTLSFIHQVSISIMRFFVSSALSVPQTNSWLTRNTCASQHNPSIWKVIYYPLSITTSNLLFSYDALPLTQACTSKSHEQKKSPNPIAYIAREKKTLQARPMTYHLHPSNTFSEEIRLTSQQRADGKQ